MDAHTVLKNPVKQSTLPSPLGLSHHQRLNVYLYMRAFLGVACRRAVRTCTVEPPRGSPHTGILIWLYWGLERMLLVSSLVIVRVGEFQALHPGQLARIPSFDFGSSTRKSPARMVRKFRYGRVS